jgi:hypothetical protein
MVKKISYIILAVAILVTGYLGFKKLNYWDRSVRIFTFKTTEQQFGRGSGRGSGQGRFEQLPDSIRARFEGRGGGPGMRNRNIPDSLRQRMYMNGEERLDRSQSGGIPQRGEGRGRGSYQGGKKINLRLVWWFLAVFSAFTVITLYTDKAYYFLKERFKGSKE